MSLSKFFRQRRGSPSWIAYYLFNYNQPKKYYK
jgi:hypothetical protein